MDFDEYDVLISRTQPTCAGTCQLVRIHRKDHQPMGWREVWSVFAEWYPGRWAVQAFPPQDQLLDQANKYHLWVLPPEAGDGGFAL